MFRETVGMAPRPINPLPGGVIATLFSSLQSRLLLLAALLSLAAAGPAAAQFGKNKVQYKNFEWQVLQTEHFDIYFYEKERDMVLDAARLSERAYTRFSRMMNFTHRRRIPLILYASHNDFQQTNVLPGDINEGIAGVNEFVKKRVLLPFTGSWKDFEHTLTHELAHAFQIDILWGDATPLANPFAYSPPLWFIEGMVEQLSLDGMTPNTEMWLRDAALSGYLMTLEELNYMPDLRSYRFGHSVWYFISQRYGNKKMGEILQKTPVFGNVGRAFKSAIGADLKTLSQQWTEDIRKTYLPQIVNFQKPEDFSRRLTRHGRDGSSYNVAPALSSTGERLAYISNRDGYIDIWSASAIDGRNRKKLVAGQRSPDFENFRFLYTSLNWSRDDRFITFVAKSGPEEAIYVLATYNNRVIHRFKFGLDGILSPSFSPDGAKIVFCGIDGGRSNLYTVEVSTGELEQLTDDKYTQRDPVYSPDGKKVAFVTEYGPGTDLDRLIFSDYRIGVLDLESGEYSILPNSFMDNISPQWSPDGRKLAYVSTRTGIPNIFYHDFDDGKDYQVTDILTGVAGPTETSPCISWSSKSGRLAYSAFFEAGWDIFVLNSPESMAREWAPDTSSAFTYETVHLNAEKSRIAELKAELERQHARDLPIALSRDETPTPAETASAEDRPARETVSQRRFAGGERKRIALAPPDMIDVDPPRAKEPLLLDSLSQKAGRLNGEWKKELLSGIEDSLALLDSLGRADSLARADSLRLLRVMSALDTLSLFRLMKNGDSVAMAALGIDPAEVAGGDSAEIDNGLLQSLLPADGLPGDTVTREAGLPPISFDFDVPKEKIPLPDTTSFTISRYKPSFSTDYVTGYGGYQGNIGATGGVIVSFSDVLDNHNMLLGANLYGKVQDSDMLFQYMYLKPRTNVGFYVTQFRDIYYLSSISSSGEYFANIWRGTGLLFSRPFDRFRRIEWSLNAYSISSKTYGIGFYYDPFSYYGYGSKLEDIENLGTVYFAGPEAALVFDNSVYGYTGPLDGSRYRLGMRQFWGELSYSELLADWRKYMLFWRRVTVAGRVIAGTRWGKNPQTFYVGGPYTFRGASYGDMRGNNLILSNLELRFPLIDHLVLGWPLPIYLRGIGGVLFFDMGGAWFKDESFQPFTGRNTSWFKFNNAQAAYGFGVRMNLGFFIAKFDFGKTLDHFQETYYLHDNKVYVARERIKGRNRNFFSIGPDF